MEVVGTCQRNTRVKFIGKPWGELEINALENKMSAARTILMACKYNKAILQRECKSQDDLEKIIRDITYIPLNTIRSFICSIQPRETFEYCLSQPIQHNSKVSRDWLRNIIYTSYLKDGIVPTKQNIVKQKLSTEYTLEDLNKDLKANGFVLQKLGNTRKALIVEKPEQVYRRMKYLNKIRNYRMQNKNFVYISFKTELYLAFSPHADILKTESNTNSNLKNSDRAFKFIQSLIPILPKSSVVILDAQDNLLNKKLEIEVKVYCGPRQVDPYRKRLIQSNSPPNPHSSKQEMKDWLSYHSIPFEDHAHTAELYAFIQKMRNKYQDTCEIRSLLENHGFDVLRVPHEEPSLNFFYPIFKQIEGLHFMTEVEYMRSIFGKCTQTKLNILEDSLKNEEIKVYSEDLELEKVIDTIRLAATRVVFVPQDLKSCNNYQRDSIPPYIILD